MDIETFQKKWIYVFPNHQGMYDVLAIIDACPKPFVVAKKEVVDYNF